MAIKSVEEIRGRASIDFGFVSSLMSDVFGIAAPIYLPWFFNHNYKSLPFPEVKMMEAETEYDDAPIRWGQKTWGAFWLKGGKYKMWDTSGQLVDYSVSDFLMPLASLVDFSRAKTVTKTPTIGGAGSVKEVYGLDDWSVSIKGIILPDIDNEPGLQTVEEQMYAMQRFHESAGSIEVEGQIFTKRNISRIVTEDLSFSPIQGKPNMMQYTIEAVSDDDILLMEGL